MENCLKEIRYEKRITQADLAKRAGISRTTLIFIENGKTDPDGKTIAKLVSVLGVPANKIFRDLDVV